MYKLSVTHSNIDHLAEVVPLNRTRSLHIPQHECNRVLRDSLDFAFCSLACPYDAQSITPELKADRCESWLRYSSRDEV